MVAMVILSVLAALAMAGYRGYLDRAAMAVDETQQKILRAASNLYAYDTNALPGSLSDLRPRDLERAYALVTEGKPRYTLLAYLEELVSGKSALAQTVLPARYYNNDPKVLVCPRDRNGGRSYQIDPAWAGRPLRDLLNPANAGATLIFETDNGRDEVFNRHANTAVSVTVGGEFHRRMRQGGGSGGSKAKLSTEDGGKGGKGSKKKGVKRGRK